MVSRQLQDFFFFFFCFYPELPSCGEGLHRPQNNEPVEVSLSP